MTLKQTVLFSFLALVGGFLGGMFANRQPLLVHAQVPQVRSENQILVPTDGLRFVTENNRTLAVLGNQRNNGVFMLMNAMGQPAVVFTAGTGGSVNVSVNSTGSQIEISSANGATVASLGAFRGEAVLLTSVQGSIASLRTRSNGASLSLPGRNNARAFELTSGQQGGVMSLFGENQKAGMIFQVGSTGGVLNVNDAQGRPAATMSGAGQFTAMLQGKQVWQAPASSE